MTPLVPFGESVFYLPLKIVKRDKGDVAQRPGIWLGVIARTQETLIGTDVGVVKCRTVTRLPDNERWNVQTSVTYERHTLGTCARQDGSTCARGHRQQREWRAAIRRERGPRA